MMRAVLDTNVLVRAVIKPLGSVGPVLQRLRHRDYVQLLSRATLDEMVDVLYRPRLRTKYGLSDRMLRAVVRLVILRSELVIPERRISACRDPKDDKFPEVAIGGGADVIVSGDEDMLILDLFEDIPIVTPARFLKMLDNRA